MTHDEKVAFVDKLYELAAVGDFDGCEAMMTDDFFITEADDLPMAGTYTGVTALRDLYTRVFGMIEVTGLQRIQTTTGGITPSSSFILNLPTVWPPRTFVKCFVSGTTRSVKSSPITLMRRRCEQPMKPTRPNTQAEGQAIMVLEATGAQASNPALRSDPAILISGRQTPRRSYLPAAEPVPRA